MQTRRVGGKNCRLETKAKLQQPPPQYQTNYTPKTTVGCLGRARLLGFPVKLYYNSTIAYWFNHTLNFLIMKSEYSSFDRFTLWLAGTDRDAIQTGCLSDNDISEQKNFGYAVAISTVVAYHVSHLLFGLILQGIGKPESYAYLASFLWAAFVCYTDRMLFKKLGAQLYFRVAMLVFNALVMSIGYQIYESDAQIDQYIRNEAATVNKDVYDIRNGKRKILTDKIEELEAQVREIWESDNIYKTKTSQPLKDIIKQKKSDLDSFDIEQRNLTKNLTHEPELSFSHKAKVFWDKFLFQSFFGVLVSLLVIFFEGLPFGIRLANHRSDYLAFMREKSRIPMGQLRKMSVADKVKLYLYTQKRNQMEGEEEDNPKPSQDDDVFPPFNFQN